MRGPADLMRMAAIGLLALGMVACGGGDSSFGGEAGSGSGTVAPAENVTTVVADGGPSGVSSRSVNTLFTTVTVCNPGSTTQCQTIDHIEIDTGSYGLRILAPVLTLTLPVQLAPDNVSSLVECTVFVDGYSWGPIALADFTIAGESVSSLPVQIIGDSRFPTVPSACSSANPADLASYPEEDTVAAFGANGILGIGVFQQDCGQYCASSSGTDGQHYYACNSAGCTPAAVPLTSQVLNPVPLFAADNNGTLISLPSVGAGGAATVTGSLIFGIDTQTNNASGTESVLPLDDLGDFTTVFNGQTLSSSFIDSGSNALFFDDSSIADCSSGSGSSGTGGFSGFYCPSTAVSLTATLQGSSGAAAAIDFSVGNAQNLANANPSFTVFPTLGGPYGTSDTFDWGLPFFYGRRVANAIEGKTTALGTGPYVGF